MVSRITFNNNIKFFTGTCDVCKEPKEVVTVCSVWGPHSYFICENCLLEGKDPYMYMVNYIAEAGLWPQDINLTYQSLVKEQLRLHNISEEQFAHDVFKVHSEMMDIYNRAELARYSEHTEAFSEDF